MGRGSSGAGSGTGNGWKKQLRAAAKKGEMPAYIMGNREQQAAIFKEIDKLFPMPDTTARIIDQGSGVWMMNTDGSVQRSGYPSGENATEAEKNGVLKWLLYIHRKKG